MQLPDKPAEHVIDGVHVQHWDIENLLGVHRLRDTQHRRGHLDVREFLDDRLHLLVLNIVDLTQRLRHWGVEGLHHGHAVLAVLAASVLFQPSLRPHLRKRWRPYPVERIHVQLEELSSPGDIDSELAPWSVVRGLSCGSPLSSWGVAHCLCHSHCDGHPLVAKPLTEPSLSPPLCGASSCVFNGSRPHEGVSKATQ